MNRRDFLKVIAATLAAPAIRPLETVIEPQPEARIAEEKIIICDRAELDRRGFVFIEDPTPLRFVYDDGKWVRHFPWLTSKT